jgi:aminopeptidase N
VTRGGRARLVAAIVLLAPAAAARGGDLDAQHLKLEISLDETRRSISGRATETFRAVRPGVAAIDLGADDLRVEAVRDGEGKALPFEARSGILHVTLPHPLAEGAPTTVAIDYQATPRRGLRFVEPSRERPRLARQVWTQSWPRDARAWFPCPEDPGDKVTSELILDTPDGFAALSNGTLVSARAGKGRRAWHWRIERPIPTFQIAFVAGEYEVVRDEAPGAPPLSLTYLVYRGRGADARKSFGHTPAILRYFSDLLQFPYPYASYSQAVVADFPYEGMENATAVTLSDTTLLDDRARLDGASSDGVVAHEAAHQWWGDVVTPRAPRDLWLSEGLATYFERLWLARAWGDEEASYRRLLDRDAVLASVRGDDARPIVAADPDDPAATLGPNVYQRSALVLDLLRRTLGDDAFWGGLRAYLGRFAFDVAGTDDLRHALETASGRDLGPFFGTWLRRAGAPGLRVTHRWDGGHVVLSLRQAGDAADDLPVDVRIVTDAGARTDSIRVDRSEEDVALPCPSPPRAVVVDPEARLPILLEQPRSASSLRVSLEEGASAAERALAARALAQTDATAAPVLAERLDREPFWGVRAEIATALGRLGAWDALDAGLRDREARVRAAALRAASSMPRPRAEAVLLAALRRDRSELAQAAALRALGAVRSPRAFETLAAALRRPSHAERLRLAALAGLAALQDPRGIPLALALVPAGNAVVVRVAAVSTLRALGRGQRVVSARLTALLEDDEARVRGAAAEALGLLGDPRARGRLREALGMESVPAVRGQMSRAIERIEADAEAREGR